MADDTDGMEEALTGQVRVALAAAGMVGEALARAREQRQRRAQASGEQNARELAIRLEAERRAARAELGVVHRPEWWNSATPEQTGRAYQIARAWAHEEPEAVRGERRISQEPRGRYGTDAACGGSDMAAVRAALAQAQQDRAHGAGGKVDATTDQAEAQALLALADQQDRQADEARAAAVHEPDPVEGPGDHPSCNTGEQRGRHARQRRSPLRQRRTPRADRARPRSARRRWCRDGRTDVRRRKPG